MRSTLSFVAAAVGKNTGKYPHLSNDRSIVDLGSNIKIGKLSPTMPFPLYRQIATYLMISTITPRWLVIASWSSDTSPPSFGILNRSRI